MRSVNEYEYAFTKKTIDNLTKSLSIPFIQKELVAFLGNNQVPRVDGPRRGHEDCENRIGRIQRWASGFRCNLYSLAYKIFYTIAQHVIPLAE
jgi:hypothetical protein